MKSLRRKSLLLCFITLLAFSASTPQQQKPEEKKPALPASLAGPGDEGIYYIYVNEDQLAKINFKWEKDGRIANLARLTIAGQSVEFKTTIDVDMDGRFVKISQESPQGTFQFTREGSTVTQKVRGQTTTVELKDGTVLFENYAPVLWGLIVRAYDAKKGGRQTVPAYIIPGAVMDIALEFQGEEERSVSGKDLKFKKYLLVFPGVDIYLYLDEADRLALADVPVQNAGFVREGYEILMKEAKPDLLLSAPKYEIIEEKNIMVQMRDGVKLATDIYRPKAEGKVPVILTRTPYKKEMAEIQARYYARRGYVYAVQDCRGRFSSKGTWEPFVNEPRDGYDSVEWLATQPWSNGKVGMIGGSYVGWVQWWAAREKPPHLVTLIPNVSPPDPFFNIPYEYGVFFLYGSIWWADVLVSEATADISGAAMSSISEKKFGKLLQVLPVVDLDKAVLGKENPYWRKWIEHPTNDKYWERANFLEYLKEVKLPVFHQSGWFDGDGIGTKLNYLKMKSHDHPFQKLVLGPWAHSDRASRSLGDLEFGPDSLLDMQRLYLRWFDYWLKGIDNGILKEPLVKIFVMGSNKWLEGDSYPLPYTQFQKWYLSSGGQANTSKGDGLLSPDMPQAETAPDTYVYDPGNPTPNPGFFELSEEEEKAMPSVEERMDKARAHHEEVTRSRQDILVYQTKPLEKPLSFAGPISAVLYASSSARDTDWFMRIVWLTKEGKTFSLAEGKIRARFRKSMKDPELLKPGEVYEYRLDIWHTGLTIPVGDSLRVEVASASFPFFSRNLNTGGHNEKETRFVKAEQKIFHSAKYPSHVLLPVIPEEKLK